MPKAAIYARISENDPTVDAIADQERRCRELAEREGYEVVAVFKEEGISAYTGRVRPAWLELNSAIQARQFDIILAVENERLVRDSAENIGFQGVCIDAGVTWHSVVDGKTDPSTAMGGLFATVRGALGQYESHIKRERVRASVQRRILAGEPLKGLRPFGFCADQRTLHDVEAEWVRFAARTVLEGGTCYSIAKAFNEAGVTTTLGKKWIAFTIRQMLVRPHNAGIIMHKGTIITEDAPALLERSEWEAVCTILNNPARTHGRGPKGGYLASGMVWCSVCESKMRRNRHRTQAHVRYICTREAVGRDVDPSPHPTMQEGHLNGRIIEWLFTRMIDLSLNGGSEAEADGIAALNVQRAELVRRRKVQQELAEMPGADIAEAGRRIAVLAAEIEDVDHRVNAMLASESQVSLLALAESFVRDQDGVSLVSGKEGLAEFMARFTALPVETQRKTFASFCQKAIIVPGRGPYRIVFVRADGTEDRDALFDADGYERNNVTPIWR